MMKSSTLVKLVTLGIGAAVIRSMLKEAEKTATAMKLQDYFPQREFIDVQAMGRSDDPEALGFLLGCINDGLGCADMPGMGCTDGALGFNIFNSPYLVRQGFEGGRNQVPTNLPQRGLTSGRDPVGAPTRIMATGRQSLSPAFRQRIVAVARGGRNIGMGDYDDGLGFSFKKIIKKAFKAPEAAIKKIVAPVKKVVSKVTTKVASDLKKVATVVKKDIARTAKQVVKPLKTDFGNAFNLLRAKDPLFKKIAPLKPQAVESSATGVTEYHDAAGNVITEADFNAQQATVDAFNQQMADMEATAPGEIQFEESTGLYWSQDAAGNWFTWNDAHKGWEPDTSAQLVTDSYASQGATADATISQQTQTDSLPDGVIYDEGTQLYWAQDDAGNWFYFDEASQQFIQEAPASTQNVQEMLPDNDSEQSLINQINSEEAGNSSQGDTVVGFWDEGTGKYWYQDPDLSWWWWSEAVQEWQPDAPIQPTVVEHETGTGGEFWSWLFDWGKGGLGHLTSRQSGNRLHVLRALGNQVEAIPLKADKDGNVYAAIGGSLGCLGCIDDLAGADGLGFKLFGRTWGEVRENTANIAKDVAGHVTPSGALYKYIKGHNPKTYKEFHREVKSATPYALIVGGTALTVVSLGTGSAAGAAAIAGGVAELAAQGYKDKVQHDLKQDAEKAANDYDEAVALQSAGSSAVREDRMNPVFSWGWWVGDVDPDQRSLLTVGEQV